MTKTKTNLNHTHRSSSYRAVNTTLPLS